MFPVLFSIGSFAVSSFGVFLAAGYILAVFLVWRLSRAWDLDEEKILDLTLLTFLGGIIGARIYFVAEHWDLFAASIAKIIFFYQLPGFSFWGGLLGGWLTLFYFSRRFKLDFWQMADIASVGFLAGVILGDIGCLLSGCGVGMRSNLFFAVSQVGNIGTRFPVQALEAILLTLALIKIWGWVTHFHLRGMIVAATLIFLSLSKLITEPLRESHGQNYFFLTTLFVLGVVIFYRITSRNILMDLKNTGLFLAGTVTKKEVRRLLLQVIKKNWYNQKTQVLWKLRNLKKVLRRLNVKFSYKSNRVD